MWGHGRLRTWGAAAGASALLLAGCAGGGGGEVTTDEAQTQLADAFGELGETSFRWSATVAIDQAALEEAVGEDAPPDAEQAFDLLAALGFEGAVDGDKNVEFAATSDGEQVIAFRLAGDLEAMQQIEETGELPGDGLDLGIYLKMDVNKLAELADDPSITEGLGQMQGMGAMFGPEIGELLNAFSQGSWVGIEGTIDQQLMDASGFSPAQAGDLTGSQEALQGAFGEDVGAALDEFTTVASATEEGGRTIVELELQAREFVAALNQVAESAGEETVSEAELTEVPETVGGLTAEIEDGHLVALHADIVALLGDVAEAAGDTMEEEDRQALEALQNADEDAISVTVELSDHGAVDTLGTPDGATTITWQTLMESVGQMLGGFGGELGG